MSHLLVDLGNTRLKWARADGAGFDAGEPLAHGGPAWADALEQAWTTLSPPATVWLAAVAREGVASVVVDVARRAFPDAIIEQVVTPRAALGVETGYVEPERLGVDRFLSLVAAWRRNRAPAVVASLGTALTVDALDIDGRHLGGLIAPSPRLMRDAVLGATGRVAWRDMASVADFGTSTEQGLESGCWHAAAALVERACDAFAVRTGTHPRLLLTGGDAARLAALVSRPSERVRDLVLEGLWHYAQASGPNAR